MTKFFSKSTGGFYVPEVHDGVIPMDALEITDDEYAALLAGQASGKRIVADEIGRPILVAPAPPSTGEMWELIKAERDRRKAGGFKVGALWFHSDADSRIQHLGLKDKARDLIVAGGSMVDNLTILGQTVRWKTMDGSFASVTAQLAFDIVAAAGDLDARLFAVAETHRAAMEAAADPAAYDFSAGWPETFGG
ncbi:DUF4376 domain-containing protein [Burkholderia cenocepacia]|uniref:DUF4376 domain-containing protein n=1 Tax=Burkholderia cenocepacia TaxID=95486 RepID=UPI001B9C0EA5|nr:DUF4376 domain-containing protein [Burkholderia cenocepacia]MBR8368540.1 DUF4376 domain-containing protein [Burkholderia cenocepacia]MBR8437477.1 DUF4376 domain-containing protein [Burkholderia cenocepacia]